MRWLKTAKEAMKVLSKQVNLDFHDLKILAVERVKHEDAFYCPDHSRAFEKQKLEHIYKMLRAERAADLASTHEPDEIRESMMLYDEHLRKKAEIIANDVFSTWIGEAALKKNQEEDPIIETKERLLSGPYMIADFISRIFLYCIVGLAFGLIGLKICCG